MKDIAKEAGVSVATVSYILNNKSGQTISEDTKCRVQEIARRFRYAPNLAARSLVKRKTGLIGMLVNRSVNGHPWQTFRHSLFLNRLERLFAESGYHMLFSSMDSDNPHASIIAEREPDGIIIADVKRNAFHEISRHFGAGTPIVVVDSLIDDPLFHGIAPDFEGAFRKAKALIPGGEYVLVTEPYTNEDLMEAIMLASGLADGDVHAMEDEEGLTRFLAKHPGKKAIAVNEFIGVKLMQAVNPTDTAVICTCGCPDILPKEAKKVVFPSDKAEIAFRIMMNHLHHRLDLPAEKRIWIGAE